MKRGRTVAGPSPLAAPDALWGVRAYPTRAEHTLVGLMTGTSADAVDAFLRSLR